jgi:hypothetical protein
MIEEKKTSFGFTAFIWHELNQKTKLFDLAENFVRANFEVSNYTTSPEIKSLFFALLINTPQSEHIFDYKNKYGFKTGIINLYGKIPYETFKEADDKTAMRLMCESYLSAILQIPTLRGMKNKNFDAQRLHDDLKKVFEEKEWI